MQRRSYWPRQILPQHIHIVRLIIIITIGAMVVLRLVVVVLCSILVGDDVALEE